MKPADAIENWLRSKARYEIAGGLLGGAVLLLLAATVLFVTFWIIFVILYLGVEWAYPLSFEMRAWLSVAGLGLLFVANFMSDPRLSERLTFGAGTMRRKSATRYLPFLGSHLDDELPAPRSAQAHAKFLGEIVLIGPRLATASILSLIHAWVCYRLDVTGCAAVLTLLLERKEAVSFMEIVPAIPAGHEVETVLTQVQDIEGVHLLEGNPDGLGLFDSLRRELRARTDGGPARRRKKGKAIRKGKKEKPQASLVLLLAEPCELDAELLTHLVNETFGLSLDAGGPDSTEFVVGEEPTFFAQFDEHIFQIMTMRGSYFEDIDSVVGEIKELRLRQAVAAHRAWLSIVEMHEYAPDAEHDVYWHLGKLLAALAPRDTLAVFWPAQTQLKLWDNNVKRMLATGQSLAAPQAVPQKVPVVGIEQDDPRMLAAVAEARRRWPEFVAAFARRRPEQVFSVKVPLGDEEVFEFMWVKVLSLDNTIIHGEVDSEPVEVTSVRCGSVVIVSREQLNDWLYTDGEDMKGGFTVKVLRDAQDV